MKALKTIEEVIAAVESGVQIYKKTGDLTKKIYIKDCSIFAGEPQITFTVRKDSKTRYCTTRERDLNESEEFKTIFTK
jgi:hypothetical protein